MPSWGLLVAALATAERVGRAAGLTASQSKKVTGPILQQTLSNYLMRGAAEAYGGPMKRGDINTVRQHVKELRQVPGAGEVYTALIKSALIDLPAKNKNSLLQLLEGGNKGMRSMLNDQKIIGFIPTKDPAKARPFFENVLGLRFVDDDKFALVFDANGTMLRVVTVKDFKPFPFTLLGWEVSNIEKTVAGLQGKGVHFERFGFMEQDKLGIWTAPGGAKVAWFKDPDGNVLSVSQHH